MHLANASLTMQLVVTGGSGQATRLTLSAAALANRPSMLLFEGSALSFLNMSFTNRVANGNRGKDPTPNPPAECAPRSADGIEVCKQDLIAGGRIRLGPKARLSRWQLHFAHGSHQLRPRSCTKQGGRERTGHCGYCQRPFGWSDGSKGGTRILVARRFLAALDALRPRRYG